MRIHRKEGARPCVSGLAISTYRCPASSREKRLLAWVAQGASPRPGCDTGVPASGAGARRVVDRDERDVAAVYEGWAGYWGRDCATPRLDEASCWVRGDAR